MRFAFEHAQPLQNNEVRSVLLISFLYHNQKGVLLLRYDIEIACTSYLTLHEQKLRIKSFLIDYFGTAHFFLVETGFSIAGVSNSRKSSCK
jgi:hypothetical protein